MTLSLCIARPSGLLSEGEIRLRALLPVRAPIT